MLNLNSFLFILSVTSLICVNNGEMNLNQEMFKKIKEEVSISNSLKLNNDYVKHLLYHPFHRLHKKHLLHIKKKHPHKHGIHNLMKKQTIRN